MHPRHFPEEWPFLGRKVAAKWLNVGKRNCIMVCGGEAVLCAGQNKEGGVPIGETAERTIILKRRQKVYRVDAINDQRIGKSPGRR